MGLDTSAELFFGISDGEEDHDSTNNTWVEDNDLDPPEGIELDHAGSYVCPIPYLLSVPTRQLACGDTNTIERITPWPPLPPPTEHVAWLNKAADQLGWPPPGWHLTSFLARG